MPPLPTTPSILQPPSTVPGVSSPMVRCIAERSAAMWKPGPSDDEAVAHGVLGDHPRLDELEQVARAAGLCARAGEAVSAERLARDHRARDRAVDVEVADRRAVDDVVDGVRVAREQPAGEAERGGVDAVARVLHVAHAV